MAVISRKVLRRVYGSLRQIGHAGAQHGIEVALWPQEGELKRRPAKRHINSKKKHYEETISKPDGKV
jgi:hypothetical protein